MVRMGQYCLDEDGVKFDYFPNIHREVSWEEIDLIERRTIEAISPKIEKVIDRDIFLFVKKGCTENEKRQKTVDRSSESERSDYKLYRNCSLNRVCRTFILVLPHGKQSLI